MGFILNVNLLGTISAKKLMKYNSSMTNIYFQQ